MARAKDVQISPDKGLNERFLVSSCVGLAVSTSLAITTFSKRNVPSRDALSVQG